MTEGEECLGVVESDYCGGSFGFIEYAERAGKIFWHRSNVIGKPLTPGAPVTFIRGVGADRQGRPRPCALEIRRLCYANYGPGDAFNPDLYEQPEDAEDSEISGGILTGVVAQFDLARGFGHIKQRDGRHIFIHESNVMGAPLAPGDQVTFQKALHLDRRGVARWQAVCVQVVDGVSR